ncbi:MAG: molecular chaperone TorD family protein, partial [Salaquimonas sp.]
RLMSESHITEVDQLRVNMYRLLARSLASPIDPEFLNLLASLEGDGSSLGLALGELASAAKTADLKVAKQEYQDLFIGVGRGELLPFGSYYLTGFLNEKPLSRLRNDMASLGIERDPSVKEPEDHAGALMDMMAGLIDGTFGKAQPLSVQQDFFKKHINNWMPHFFKDLAAAKHANVLQPVGKIGGLFLEIEESAFAM